MKVTAFLSTFLGTSLLAGTALAGPSVLNTVPPGGFASACASDLSSGVTYTPGLDITASFGFFTGHFSCQSQVFAGANGQSAAAAEWHAPNANNQSSVQAGMGLVRLAASNTARTNVQFPVATAAGGWSEAMTINLAGHAGEAAVWLFTVIAGGTLDAAGGNAAVMLNAHKNQEELSFSVAGYNKGGSDPLGTDRQRVQWGVSRSGNRSIADAVTFAVPITLGQSFAWGVYATASAGLAAWSPGQDTLVSSNADFSHTLRYGGSAGVVVGGVNHNNAQFTSVSGIDWTHATAVPEPGTRALLLAGLAALAVFAARSRHRFTALGAT
jgi:hypothetical protein